MFEAVAQTLKKWALLLSVWTCSFEVNRMSFYIDNRWVSSLFLRGDRILSLFTHAYFDELSVLASKLCSGQHLSKRWWLLSFCFLHSILIPGLVLLAWSSWWVSISFARSWFHRFGRSECRGGWSCAYNSRFWSRSRIGCFSVEMS